MKKIFIALTALIISANIYAGKIEAQDTSKLEKTFAEMRNRFEKGERNNEFLKEYAKLYYEILQRHKNVNAHIKM